MMKTAVVILFLTLGVFYSSQDEGPQVCQGFCSAYKERPPSCMQEHNPVCGSNSRTYNNICSFCQAVYDHLGSLCFKKYGYC